MNMIMNTKEVSKTGIHYIKSGITLCLFAMLVVSCEGILEVDAPTTIEEGEINNPERADLLLEGTVADFEWAFDRYILMSGVLGNELQDATFTAAKWPLDQRQITESITPHSDYEAHTPLSTARWQADNAYEKFDEWEDDGYDFTNEKAVVSAYGGYSRILLGEGFCRMAFDLGEELSQEEVWEQAVDQFDRAITYAESADNDDIANFARVGIARAYLNLGNLSDAVTYAEQVEEGFEFLMLAEDDPRRRNAVYQQTIDFENVTIGEFYRDFDLEGETDPRVEVIDEERDSDGIPYFTTTKYDGLADEIPIARWEEAQLIIAEHEGGQTAVDIINDLREPHGLPEFESDDEGEILEQVVEERLREFFLESHTLNDIVRYDEVELTPAPGETHPRGGTYGDQTCLPLPAEEVDNNPNL